MKKFVKSGAELVPENKTSVGVVTLKIVVSPQLIWKVENLTLSGDHWSLEVHSAFVGYTALVYGDATSHVSC